MDIGIVFCLCLIIFVVSIFTFLLTEWSYKLDKITDIALCTGVISVFGVIFCIVSCCCVSELGDIQRISDKPKEILELVSMEDNNLYVSAFTDEDLYYQFLYKSDKGFQYEKVKAKNTFVIIDNKKPRIETYVSKKQWFCFYIEEEIYKLYVPKDSIEYDYNIDLQ